jgi:hypothetical protein
VDEEDGGVEVAYANKPLVFATVRGRFSTGVVYSRAQGALDIDS